ncbi:hypothetical protein [Chitinimonas naiadis]
MFEHRARAVAVDLGSDYVEILAGLFHSEHSPPPELAHQFPGLGQWVSARQFAIFEVFYFVGEPALPVLRRVAFGVYDWTQGNAIEILCRLAADGIDRANTLDALKRQLPDIQDEALYYAIGPLIRRAEQNPSVREILDELLVVPEFRDSYEYFLSSNA